MMGQDGADRYRVEINAARQEGQPVMFINNRANDGKLDTLEVRTKLTPTEFIWQRSGDDLWLSVKPEDQARQAEPRVVVAGYYQDAGRRHLEVRFVDTGGALQGHIREDQLEALSLDPQQTRSMEDNTDLQAPPPRTLQKLIEEMARFTSPGGVGDASMVRPQDRPVVSLLAPAAA
jgi:hypothetical protein